MNRIDFVALGTKADGGAAKPSLDVGSEEIFEGFQAIARSNRTTGMGDASSSLAYGLDSFSRGSEIRRHIFSADYNATGYKQTDYGVALLLSTVSPSSNHKTEPSVFNLNPQAATAR